jgi:hypothetical protein
LGATARLLGAIAALLGTTAVLLGAAAMVLGAIAALLGEPNRTTDPVLSTQFLLRFVGRAQQRQKGCVGGSKKFGVLDICWARAGGTQRRQKFFNKNSILIGNSRVFHVVLA